MNLRKKYKKFDEKLKVDKLKDWSDFDRTAMK